ncbi:MAG: hypothetical protein LBR17_08475 [Bacteroidales bacterium]|jgi:hypothetical protein|nr:hypothetical protein [Bacteroidales bacterium]
MKKAKMLMSAVMFSIAALFSVATIGLPITALAVVFGGATTGVLNIGGLTPEIWEKDIVENIFKNNEFLLKSVDESQYVVGGTVVHIPQAGAPSAAVRNRTNLPATITTRTDVDITYPLDEITTDPRRISQKDIDELSYDKRQSVISEDRAAINEFVAECILGAWKPSYYIKTTGAGAAATYGTGNRKALTYNDFKNAKQIFNKWGIPKTDRYVVLPSELINQLTTEIKAMTTPLVSAVYSMSTGQLEKLEGFTIFERATVALASSTASLTAVTNKPYFESSSDIRYTPEQFVSIEFGTTNPADTAAMIGLFWQKSCVCRAVGETRMFSNEGDPTYFSDIYSFLQRVGGRARRADGRGILGIVEEAA